MLRLQPSRVRSALSLLGLAVLLLAACGPDRPAGQGDRDRSGSLDPPPVVPGDPEQRLADEGEVPVEEIDQCGLDARTVGADPDLDPGRAAGLSEYAREPVSFAVQVQDEVNPHRLMSAFVMPGESMELEPLLTERGDDFVLRADAGTLEQTAPGRWRWTAPEAPGIHCITVEETDSGETMCVNAFVLTPWDGREVLNGYRIGRYPTELYRGLESYRAPEGFIEVTEENEETWITPHLQLEQFVCKQASGYPKYMTLRTRLLLKLERLLSEAQEAGIPVETFYVMSGYRTPFYNEAIGNQTTFSRHTHGDAADIFVDRDRDGRMDDIDGSGTVTVGDARSLAVLVEALYDRPWYRPFIGGLGIYGPAPHRGPFIHVDTRGYRARW